MSRKTFSLDCPYCGGSGFTESAEYEGSGTNVSNCSRCGGEGGGYRDYRDRYKSSSGRDCKGKGKIEVEFEITNHECSACNGKRKIDWEVSETGTDHKGSYRRKYNETKVCYQCLGTGKALQIYKERDCSDCGGSGKTTKWETSFWSDMERPVEYTCQKCKGRKIYKELDTNIWKGDLY